MFSIDISFLHLNIFYLKLNFRAFIKIKLDNYYNKYLQNKTNELKKKDSPVKEKTETNGTIHDTKEIQYDLKSMNLVPGSRVEAKNFNGEWTTARVVEVDNDENEILIQFESSK